LNRPDSESQKEIYSLFSSQEGYETFRKKVRQFLFSSSEVLLLLIGAALFFVGLALMSCFPLFWELMGMILVINLAQVFIGTILAFGALHLCIGTMRTIHFLSSRKKDFRIWKSVQYLSGKSRDKSQFMSYQNFQQTASGIGRFVYNITFRLILLMVSTTLIILVISWDIMKYVTLEIWILATGIIIAAFFIFIIPQLGMHKLLSEVKKAMLKMLEEEFDHLEFQYVTKLRGARMSRGRGKSVGVSSSLREEITTLGSIIERTRKGGTWSFEMPHALKLLFASAIPLLGAIVESLIPALLASIP
jgi:hypothetical protein